MPTDPTDPTDEDNGTKTEEEDVSGSKGADEELPAELTPGTARATGPSFPDTQDAERIADAIVKSKDAEAKRQVLKKLIDAMGDDPWKPAS